MSGVGQVPNWANAVTMSLLQVLRNYELGTFEHSLRIGELAKQLAVCMGLNEYQQRVAEVAGLLHDIGDSAIDQDILAKPTKLNAIEFQIMKSHVNASVDFVAPLAAISPFFKDVLDAVRWHHEHFNGTGYPDKLVGEQIPIIARMLNLIDAYDSMTTARVYKEALSVEQAYAEIKKDAGTQFDSKIVTIFTISHRFFKKQSISDLENQLYRRTG